MREEGEAGPAGASGNNPYHRAAGFYDLNLSLPIISFIRRQEARAVSQLIARYADPGARALEIGPGTGFYTVELARGFGEVVAVEESESMAAILRRKLRAGGVFNVTVVNQDFLTLPGDASFQLVAAVGVLDYIRDPIAFVTRMCAASRQAVIFTVPQQGLWGRCFAAANRLRKTAVYCYQRQAPSRWSPQWHCTIAEVGLKTPLTKGLTLVAALERR